MIKRQKQKRAANKWGHSDRARGYFSPVYKAWKASQVWAWNIWKPWRGLERFVAWAVKLTSQTD